MSKMDYLYADTTEIPWMELHADDLSLLYNHRPDIRLAVNTVCSIRGIKIVKATELDTIPLLPSHKYINTGLIVSRTEKRTFWSREHNGFRSYRCYLYTYPYDSIIDARPITNVIMGLFAWAEEHNQRPFLFVMSDGNNTKFCTKKAVRHGLYDKVYSWLNKYDTEEVVEVSDICVQCVTKSGESIIANNIVPRGLAGEREYKKLLKGGWWRISRLTSVKDCSIDALAMWLNYTLCKENFMSRDDFRRHKVLIASMCRGMDVSDVGTLCDRFGLKYTIVHSRDQLRDIDPDDTISHPHFFLKREHYHILVHKKHVTKDNYSAMKWRSRNSYLGKIYPRKTNTSKKDYKRETISTADIECVRSSWIRDSDNNIKKIEHIPYMVSYYHEDVPYVYKGDTCIQDFILDVNEYVDNAVIWMHNGGNYDMHIILDHLGGILTKNRPEPAEIVDDDGTIVKMVLYLDKGNSINTITFKDSYRMLPNSLSDLCTSFNVHPELRKMGSIDSTAFTKQQILEDPEIEEYCIRDSASLALVLAKYRDMCLDLGWDDPIPFTTLPSYMKQVFLSKYYDAQNHTMYSPTKMIHKIIRRGYLGGRCEKMSDYDDKELYTYDYNSMYPYVGTKDLPIGTGQLIINLDWDILRRSYVERYMGFYRVLVTRPSTNTDPIGLHLYKRPDGSITKDWDSSNEMILFSAEILKGMDLGYSYMFRERIEYSRGPVFKTFFEDLYRLRLKAKTEGNDTLAYILKVGMNSGYGSWGFAKYGRQVMRVYNEDQAPYIENMRMRGELDFNTRDGLLYAVQKIDITTVTCNVAVAAAITSYARIHLYEGMVKMLDTGAKIYYCDTDNMIVDKPLPIDSADVGIEMGKLKLEYAGWNMIDGVIADKKVLGMIYTREVHKDDTLLYTKEDVSVYSTKDKHEAFRYNDNDLLVLPVVKIKGVNTKTSIDNTTGKISRLSVLDRYNIVYRLKDAHTRGTTLEFMISQIRKSRLHKSSSECSPKSLHEHVTTISILGT